jgi:predicted N-acyltransferase
MQKYEINFVDSITEIGAEAWNQVTGTDNPFTRYEFLHALEETGCTTAATGWAPHHVAVYSPAEPLSERAQEKDEKARRTDKTLVAVMPLYLKTNSYGEYVFDWSWAHAYQNHGYEYYPKFVSAIPFTPSVGNRLCVSEPAVRARISEVVRNKVIEKAEAIAASSWHILFPQQQEHDDFERLGISSRIASQFHWYNKGYTSFDDFLNSLNSRKRKSIRKERQRVRDQGISFKITEGGKIAQQQWQNFYSFYQSTYAMRGMQGYLNQEFFQTLSITMPEQLFMISAMQDRREIAAALFFKSSDKLFGRYWGSARDEQFLHFETCYYQGQGYCIEHGLSSFDSGAQGEHKIQRGFEPIITYSNHWLANQGFAAAIENFLQEEREHIKSYMLQARALLPYKKES